MAKKAASSTRRSRPASKGPADNNLPAQTDWHTTDEQEALAIEERRSSTAPT